MACLTQDIAIFPPIPHQYFRADDLELKSVFTCPEINFGRGPSENEPPIPWTSDWNVSKLIFSKKTRVQKFHKITTMSIYQNVWEKFRILKIWHFRNLIFWKIWHFCPFSVSFSDIFEPGQIHFWHLCKTPSRNFSEVFITI